MHTIGLIEMVDKGELNKHAAIFYKLSSFGVYYAIRNNLAGVELLSNHGKDPLFQIILYRFISRQTVQELKTQDALVRINEHLRRCCEIIEERLKSFERLKEAGEAIHLLCRWDEILDPLSFGRESFLKFLKKSLSMNWVKNDLEIIQEAQDVIKISLMEHAIYLKLIDSKAILFDGNRKVHQFDVAHGYHPGLCYGRLVPNLIGIGHSKPFKLKSEILEMFRDIDRKVIDKAFEFCFSLVKNYSTGSAEEDEIRQILQDYKNLSADENFRHLFETTGHHFDTYRNKFMKLREKTAISFA